MRLIESWHWWAVAPVESMAGYAADYVGDWVKLRLNSYLRLIMYYNWNVCGLLAIVVG